MVGETTVAVITMATTAAADKLAAARIIGAIIAAAHNPHGAESSLAITAIQPLIA